MDTTTMVMLLAVPLLSVGVYVLMQQPTEIVRWVQRKNYQYEVTFALYMLTPTEKFVFNSILFLLTALFVIASILYLPNHLAAIGRRTYYYCVGDESILSTSRQAAETLYSTATRAGDAMIDAATGWAQTAYQAAWNKTNTMVG